MAGTEWQLSFGREQEVILLLTGSNLFSCGSSLTRDLSIRQSPSGVLYIAYLTEAIQQTAASGNDELGGRGFFVLFCQSDL